MGLIKLIYNELVKILKRKVVYVFAFFILVSIIFSCVLVHINKKDMSKLMLNASHNITDDEIELNKSFLMYEISKDDASEYDKKVANKKIEIWEYIQDKGKDNIINAPYRYTIHTDLENLYAKLYSLNKNDNENEYNILENDITRLWEIFNNGTFEEYIQFNVDNINRDYKNGVITEAEYEQKLKQYEENLKYGLERDYSTNAKWKNEILTFINNRKGDLISRVSGITEKFYLEDDDFEEVKNQIILAEYRLQNNKPPYFTEQQKINDINSYSRYKYNEFANKFTIIVIGLLLIVLSASSISDEFIKGTIKFALITPYKKYKVLLAKIISLIIIMLIMVLITSQVSILVGNIVFGTNNNEHLYVKNGNVEVMSIYLYEFLQYILRIPELIIYILIGITMSSLTKNTPVSTIVTTAVFIGIPTWIDYINNQYIRIDSLRYLPFTNFNLAEKILKIYTFSASFEEVSIYQNTLGFSIFLIVLFAVLLLITVFDSFRKKEV